MLRFCNSSHCFWISTWNVEGLAEEQLLQITSVMTRRQISVLWIQETHSRVSEKYLTFGNLLVLVAGHDKADQREYAGVGFIIAPHIVPSIIGASCYSNRIACLKLRVPGGNACICSMHAPHNGHSLRVRQSFFAQLICRYNSVSAHGPKLIYGDLNARIHHRLAGEDPIIGPFPFGDPLAIISGSKNR